MEAITMAAVGGTWEWVARRAGGKKSMWGTCREGGGERGRGLTAVAALRSVVGAREWYTRATAVVDASAQQPQSIHMQPQHSGITYCSGDPM
jgi:hypothetical protein